MTCTSKIFKNIISDCSTTPTGGMESVVYLVNRVDLINPVYSGNTLITDFSLVSGTTAYKLVSTKKSANFGSDRVTTETMPDQFKHFFSFQNFEFDALAIDNLDTMNDLVAIVERKDKKGDTPFTILGIGSGLYVSSDTSRTNDNNGVRVLEMTSMDGQLETNSEIKFLKSDYSTTKAFLEALL